MKLRVAAHGVMALIITVSAGTAGAETVNRAALQQNEMALQKEFESHNGSKTGAYWDLAFAGLFAATGGVGIAKSSSAKDAREEAEELATSYAAEFLLAITDASYWLALYEEDQAFHGGTSAALLWSKYQLALGDADLALSLGSVQSGLADDKQDEEALWKGVAYTSFVVSAIFLFKAIIGLTKDAGGDSVKSSNERIQMISSIYPERRLGVQLRF